MQQTEKFLSERKRYHCLLFIPLFFPFIISGIQTLAFTFTAAVPPTRCMIPGLDAGLESPFWTPDINLETMAQWYPRKQIDRGKAMYCHYCPNGTRDGQNCTMQNSLNCDHGYIFDRSQYHSSLAMELGLVCDSGAWKRELATTLFMAGLLIGSVSSGILSDYFGRKNVFLMFSFVGIVAHHLRTITTNYILLCLLHLLSGTLSHGAYVSAYVIIIEITSGTMRTVYGVLTAAVFCLGYMFVGLMAYVVREWQILQLSLSIWTLLLLPHYWIMPPSLKWLLSQGRRDEAKKYIKSVAKIDGTPVSDQEVEKMIENDIKDSSEDKEEGQQTGFLEMFKHWPLARQSIIIFYCWFSASMLYYGLSLNSTNLPGDDYVNYVLVGFMEIPGCTLVIFQLEKIGRKPTHVIMMTLAGIFVVASAVIPQQYGWLIVTCAMLGKLCVAAAFAGLYNYTAELFPTPVRNTMVGVGSMVARVGSMTAPQIYLLGLYVEDWLPFFIYGCAAILAGSLLLFLPETKRRNLPETLEDAVTIAASASVPSLQGFYERVSNLGDSESKEKMLSIPEAQAVA